MAGIQVKLPVTGPASRCSESLAPERSERRSLVALPWRQFCRALSLDSDYTGSLRLATWK
jgi:hypothetical protein